MRIISPSKLIILTVFIIFLIFTRNCNAETQPASTPIPIPTHIQNIYKFLLADIALYRNQPQISIENLQELLANYDDPKIAQTITEYAIELEDYSLSVAAAAKWAELDPANFKAQLIAVTMLLEDNPILVEKFLYQAMKADPLQADVQLSNLLPKLLEHHKNTLLEILNTLAKKYPLDPIVQLCLAQVAAQTGDIHTATIKTKYALNLKNDLTHAIFLQAKLIRYSSKSDDLALSYLNKQVAIFPKNEELQLFYVNALLDSDKIKETLPLLKKLIVSKHKNYQLEATLLTAEIYLQKQYLNLEKAKLYLNKLINANYATSKTAFLLGQIAEQQQDDTAAINWYTSINKEPYHVIGYFRAATILANNQQIPQAIDLLNQTEPSTLLETKQLLLFKIELALGIKDLKLALFNADSGLKMLPNDVDFLYARSIISSLDNKLEIAEKDLKHILSLQPDNHSVLNTLGYLLASHTSRKKEALSYLQQALDLSPNNPIYMDSMGWLLYKTGKIQDALDLLSQAYKLENAPIIATHLGEVLWANGQQQQATTVWQKAWVTDPNDLELLNTLKQYKINFAK